VHPQLPLTGADQLAERLLVPSRARWIRCAVTTIPVVPLFLPVQPNRHQAPTRVEGPRSAEKALEALRSSSGGSDVVYAPGKQTRCKAATEPCNGFTARR
jgi:hypothetical protein